MASTIQVLLEADREFGDLQKKNPNDIIHISEGTLTLATLSKGTKSGRTSVILRVDDLPDGKVLIFETTLLALMTADSILRARYAAELGNI